MVISRHDCYETIEHLLLLKSQHWTEEWRLKNMYHYIVRQRNSLNTYNIYCRFTKFVN